MKVNHKKADALDELLRLWVLEHGAEFSWEDDTVEQMAEFVFNSQPTSSPSAKKSAEILARLQDDLKNLETFGDLLISKMQNQNIELTALAKETQLSIEFIKQLLENALFPTRVPVLLMKRLVEFLDIPLEKAKAALRRTASLIIDSLKTDTSLSFSPTPARRRSSQSSGIGFQLGSEIDIHSAPSALEAYLERLDALFANQDIRR